MLELIAFLFFGAMLAFLQVKGFSHPVLWFVLGCWAFCTKFQREPVKE